jgi:hypothetical protein
MMNDKEMVTAVRGLGMTKSQFAVCGSSVLMIHGLVSLVRDIDIIAYGDAWEHVCNGRQPRKAPLGDNVVSFREGQIEVFDGWSSTGWRVQDMIAEADLIDGIRYIRLERILENKLWMNRPKDQEHIALIQDAIAKRNATKAEK